MRVCMNCALCGQVRWLCSLAAAAPRIRWMSSRVRGLLLQAPVCLCAFHFCPRGRLNCRREQVADGGVRGLRLLRSLAPRGGLFWDRQCIHTCGGLRRTYLRNGVRTRGASVQTRHVCRLTPTAFTDRERELAATSARSTLLQKKLNPMWLKKLRFEIRDRRNTRQ